MSAKFSLVNDGVPQIGQEIINEICKDEFNKEKLDRLMRAVKIITNIGIISRDKSVQQLKDGVIKSLESMKEKLESPIMYCPNDKPIMTKEEYDEQQKNKYGRKETFNLKIYDQKDNLISYLELSDKNELKLHPDGTWSLAYISTIIDSNLLSHCMTHKHYAYKLIGSVQFRQLYTCDDFTFIFKTNSAKIVKLDLPMDHNQAQEATIVFEFDNCTLDKI